jgi:hypothetical protein
MTCKIIRHAHIKHHLLDFWHFIICKFFFLNLIFDLWSNRDHSFTFFFEWFEIWESTANFFLVCLALSFNVLTNLFYTNSSSTTFQNILRIELLLFNFSLRLKWFHPHLNILSFYHHIIELLPCVFIRKFPNMKLDVFKFLNKSRWLGFFHFKVILFDVRKLSLNTLFI